MDREKRRLGDWVTKDYQIAEWGLRIAEWKKQIQRYLMGDSLASHGQSIWFQCISNPPVNAGHWEKGKVL